MSFHPAVGGQVPAAPGADHRPLAIATIEAAAELFARRARLEPQRVAWRVGVPESQAKTLSGEEWRALAFETFAQELGLQAAATSDRAA